MLKLKLRLLALTSYLLHHMYTMMDPSVTFSKKQAAEMYYKLSFICLLLILIQGEPLVLYTRFWFVLCSSYSTFPGLWQG